jgi:uncharacterized protein
MTMQIKLTPVSETPARRECGECSLCCLLLAIKELDKPQNEWCKHVRAKRGCSIYEQRPDVCRGFECLWLSSTISPLALRPDKIHGLMTPSTDGEHIVLHEHPRYPGIAHAAMREMLDKWIEDGTRYYVVVCGARRTFFGNPALLPEATEMLNETGHPLDKTN